MKPQVKLNTKSVYEELKSVLTSYNIQSVAEVANVHVNTIYHWLEGYTKAPRIDTIDRVAKAVGHRIELRLVTKPTAKRYRHLRVVK